jgi:hypothetical protein
MHLNPVRATMVGLPADWAWSSDPGYPHRRQRVEWLAYIELLAAWDGAFGESDSAVLRGARSPWVSLAPAPHRSRRADFPHRARHLTNSLRD